jgi:hypothetical protein
MLPPGALGVAAGEEPENFDPDFAKKSRVGL